MKSCPACNRTFEDTFTFCLVDGSILSAPFDPHATKQTSNVRHTAPPPTQVMPPQNFPNSKGALPPTMPSPQAGYTPPFMNNAAAYSHPQRFAQRQYSEEPTRKKKGRILRAIAIALGGISLLITAFGGRDRMLALFGLLIAIVLLIISIVRARGQS